MIASLKSRCRGKHINDIAIPSTEHMSRHYYVSRNLVWKLLVGDILRFAVMDSLLTSSSRLPVTRLLLDNHTYIQSDVPNEEGV